MPDTSDTSPRGLTRREAAQAICATAALGMMTFKTFGKWIAPSAAPNAALLEEAAMNWGALESRLAGELILRDASTFEATRQALVWNGLKPQRSPEAIVRAKSAKDVQEAVRFARANQLKVAIRGGGHSWVGSSVRDNGVLIDLGAMNEVTIDAENRKAVVQPAVQGGEFIELLAPLGLAFPTGHCDDVALSGFLLNGGFGWNSGQWGPACLSVEAIDIVDSRGELIRADAEQNTEYLWAARGAGPGFFGVAVQYHLRLHALPKVIQSQAIFYPIREVQRVSQWMEELRPKLPPTLELQLMVMTAPPGLPAEIASPGEHLLMLAIAVFADSAEQARASLAMLDGCPASIKRLATPVEAATISKLYRDSGVAYPKGHRYAVELSWTNAPLPDVLERVMKCMGSAPSPESFVMIPLVPTPPADAPPPPDMALSMFGRAVVGAHAVTTDPAHDQASKAWVRKVSEALEPIKVGHYVGETNLDEDKARPSQCYGPAQWKRLEALRAKYDPEGVFHNYLAPKG